MIRRMKIPEELRKLRGALTQAEAARRVGVATLTWLRWEHGTRTPRLVELAGIFALFGKPMPKHLHQK